MNINNCNQYADKWQSRTA